MHWHEQYDKEHQPTMAQIGAYVASPLWDALTGHLHNTYGITPRIAYSGCSMEQNRWKGWNIKYQKGGKSLCTLYPKQGHFLALLPLSLLEMSEAEVLVDTCSPYGLPPIFVPTCELVKTVRWHPHSFLGLATW